MTQSSEQFGESIESGMPPRREGEPGGLRRDIADELADHLACALRDETLGEGDEEVARKNVLDRFGDPGSIARRLWLDAMKETIMKDRILVVGMLAIVVLVGGMGWLMVQQNREQRAVMGAMLERLEAMESREVATSAPLNPMTEARVQVIDEAGAPLVGASVTMNGSSGLVAKALTDEKGWAEFGQVDAQMSRLAVILDDGIIWDSRGKFGLQPGVAFSKIITAPGAINQVKRLRFVIDWPEDLKDREHYVQFELSLDNPQIVGEDGLWMWSRSRDQYVIGPEGSIYRLAVAARPSTYETLGLNLQGWVLAPVDRVGVPGFEHRVKIKGIFSPVRGELRAQIDELAESTAVEGNPIRAMQGVLDWGKNQALQEGESGPAVHWINYVGRVVSNDISFTIPGGKTEVAVPLLFGEKGFRYLRDGHREMDAAEAKARGE